LEQVENSNNSLEYQNNNELNHPEIENIDDRWAEKAEVVENN